jgi:hypothetical protein
MNNSKLVSYAFVHSILVFLYTTGVVWLLSNGNKLFGTKDTFWSPVLALLLFVLSATIVGSLVLVRPAYLYFSGLRQEAVKLLAFTVGWLVLITAIVMVLMVIAK